MTRDTTTSLVATLTHARHVTATDRERFATDVRRDVAGRAVLLSTCHRVEAYVTDAADAARLAAVLPSGGRTLSGESAVRHAISVTVGRDSVVLGEDQILHQVRDSLESARAARALDPELDRLFSVALQAGRRARSWRHGPPRSLADVAVASIGRQAGPIHGRDVLVVGAGRMGRLAAKAAVAAGASVAVANRSAEGARALATSVHARVEAFDPGRGVSRFAGVVVALGGPWPIAAATVRALARGATVVVDLSMPPAVPAELGEILGPRLMTADALALSDAGFVADDRTARRLDALIDRSTSDFLAWLEGRDGRATADTLVRNADREREAALAALWQRFPDLEPEARDAIEGMTRHLASRLLRKPLERLGRDVDGRDEQAIRDIFAL